MQENETQNQIPVDKQPPSSSEPKKERTIDDIEKDIIANRSKRHEAKGLKWLGHAIKDIGRHLKRQSLENKIKALKEKALNELKEAITSINTTDLKCKMENYLDNDDNNPYNANKMQSAAGYRFYIQSKLAQPHMDCMFYMTHVLDFVSEMKKSKYQTVCENIEANQSQMTLNQQLEYIRNETQNATSSGIMSHFKSYCDGVYSGYIDKNKVMNFDKWCEHKKKKLIGIFKKVQTSAKSSKEGEKAAHAFIEVVTQCLNNKTAAQEDINLALKCVNTMIDSKITRHGGPKRFWDAIENQTKLDFCPYNITNNNQKKIYGLAVIYTVDNVSDDDLLEQVLNKVKDLDKL